MHADVNGADTQVGVCAVRTHAVDGDFETVVGVHHGVLIVVHIQTQRNPTGSHVECHSHIGLGIFQRTGGNHSLAALEGLFCRLEYQLDHTLQIFLILFQHLCSAEQPCSMQVMSAGMGCAGGACKRLAGFFHHRQCVHICPEQNHLSAGLAHCCHQAVFNNALRLVAHFSQLFFQIIRSLFGLQTHFCILVNIPAGINHHIFDFFRSFQIIHGINLPFKIQVSIFYHVIYKIAIHFSLVSDN